SFTDHTSADIYTLSLHDALPIYLASTAAAKNVPKSYREFLARQALSLAEAFGRGVKDKPFTHVADLAATESYRRGLPLTTASVRSEEHTSELQSLRHLVCRLLLE